MSDPHKIKWTRPFCRDQGPFASTPCCLDCEHYRVGGMPNRMCSKYPSKHMYHMIPEDERRATREVMAEGCPEWVLASEFRDASLKKLRGCCDIDIDSLELPKGSSKDHT